MQWTEQTGDGVQALGGAAVPAARTAPQFQLQLATWAADGLPDTLAARFTLRRQVRSLLNNSPLKFQGFLYIVWSDDQEQNGWYLPDQGPLTDMTSPVGLATGLWQLQQPWLKAGAPRTHREARSVWMKDMRTGLYPRDQLGWIYSTDFAALPALQLSVIPNGAVSVANAVSSQLVAPTTLPTGRDGGACQLVSGQADLTVLAYERPGSALNMGDVIVYDRQWQITAPATGPDTGWEEVYGPDYPWSWSAAKTIRALLTKAAAGSLIRWGFIGDSKTAATGLFGARPTQAVPYVIRQLFANAGIPSAGTGFATISNIAGYDTRWTLTGAWTGVGANPLWATAPNNATGTFVSDAAGTVVDVYYYGNSGIFQVKIDGAAPVVITPAGGNTVQKYEVTGLANTTHTVVITALQNNVFILGAAVLQTTGLLCQNFGVGGTKTSDWTSTAFTTGMFNALGIGADIVSVELGANDINSGVSISAFAANLSTILSSWPSAAKLLVVESNTAFASSAAWAAFAPSVYALAASLGIPVLDMTQRWGSSANATALGFLSSDSIHEAPAGDLDKASAYIGAVT